MTLPNFLSILSRSDVAVLRNMRRPIAATWLRSRWPDMTPEDYNAALALSPEVPPVRVATSVHIDPLRNLFITAAWLAGASVMQLARLHGLSRQRVMEITHGRLPPDKHVRAAMRLGDKATAATLDAWHDAFYTFAKSAGVEAVALMDPLEVAAVLPHLPGAEGDDADDQE